MAIKVVMEIDIKPENAEQFKGMLPEALKATRAREGFIAIDVAEDAAKPGALMFNETWETKEHYDAYFAWRVETGFLDQIGPMLAGEPKVRIFNPTPG